MRSRHIDSLSDNTVDSQLERQLVVLTSHQLVPSLSSARGWVIGFPSTKNSCEWYGPDGDCLWGMPYAGCSVGQTSIEVFTTDHIMQLEAAQKYCFPRFRLQMTHLSCPRLGLVPQALFHVLLRKPWLLGMHVYLESQSMQYGVSVGHILELLQCSIDLLLFVLAMNDTTREENVGCTSHNFGTD